MDMDGWRDILHFDFHGEHVLLAGLRLSSWSQFIWASILTVALCSLEKYLSFLLSSKSNARARQRSPLQRAVLRAGIYWVVTLIRLLIMVVVTTLTAGQFIIDLVEGARLETRATTAIEDAPLLRPLTPDVSREYLDLPQGSAYPPRPASKRREESKRHQVNGTRSETVFSIEDEDENI